MIHVHYLTIWNKKLLINITDITCWAEFTAVGNPIKSQELAYRCHLYHRSCLPPIKCTAFSKLTHCLEIAGG